MKTSELINELASALAKAQAELKNVAKNKTNPHFKNDYADLDANLEEIRPKFSKHGLSLVQGTDIVNDKVVLVSRIIHTSGQWIESQMPLVMDKQNMQGAGSAISYARRYLAQAMAGVAQTDEDDDGNKSAEDTLNQDEAVKEITQLLKTLGKKESDFITVLQTTNKRDDIETFYDLKRKEAEAAIVFLKDMASKATKPKTNGAAHA